MKKAIGLIVCLSSFIFANSDKEVFIDKYMKKNEFSTHKKEAENYRKNISSDVNLKEISKKERKEIDIKIEENIHNKKAEKIANEIRRNVESSKFKKQVNDYKDYILRDKQLNFSDKMGVYKEHIKKNPSVNYKNKLLKSDERLIIAISSSIPKDVIHNYFKSLHNHTEVLFILNGFIGNDPKKIMPTIKYVNDLLSKDEKEKYKFRVDINPKLFSKYEIKEVPAVVFIKNYNPFLEIQGNGNQLQTSNEEVYVSYGDSKIDYVLKKINKDAKSKGLNKLIKNINKGFFNE